MQKFWQKQNDEHCEHQNSLFDIEELEFGSEKTKFVNNKLENDDYKNRDSLNIN